MFVPELLDSDSGTFLRKCELGYGHCRMVVRRTARRTEIPNRHVNVREGKVVTETKAGGIPWSAARRRVGLACGAL
jgi:hypothetical protein